MHPDTHATLTEAETIVQLCLAAKRSDAADTIEMSWPLGVAARLVRSVIARNAAKRRRPMTRDADPLLTAATLIESAIVVNDDAGASVCTPDYSHLLVLAAASLRESLERGDAVAVRRSRKASPVLRVVSTPTE